MTRSRCIISVTKCSGAYLGGLTRCVSPNHASSVLSQVQHCQFPVFQPRSILLLWKWDPSNLLDLRSLFGASFAKKCLFPRMPNQSHPHAKICHWGRPFFMWKNVLNQKQKGTPRTAHSVPQSIIVFTSLLRSYRLDGHTFQFMFRCQVNKNSRIFIVI